MLGLQHTVPSTLTGARSACGAFLHDLRSATVADMPGEFTPNRPIIRGRAKTRPFDGEFCRFQHSNLENALGRDTDKRHHGKTTGNVVQGTFRVGVAPAIGDLHKLFRHDFGNGMKR
jgi:hypothetical protein